MAKEKNAPSESNVENAVVIKGDNSVQQMNSNGTEIIQISEDAFLTTEQMDALLRNEETIEEQLSAEYLKGDSLEIGEVLKFVYKGTKQIKNNKGEEIDAVILYGTDRKQYINASSIVVSDCKSLTPFSTISVTYKGKKQGKSGFTFDNFAVSVLHHIKK